MQSETKGPFEGWAVTPAEEQQTLARLRERFPEHAVSDEEWLASIRAWHDRLPVPRCRACLAPLDGPVGARLSHASHHDGPRPGA